MKNIVLAFIMTAGVAFSGFAQDTTITIRPNPPATTTPPPATTTPPPATVAPVQEYNPAFRLGFSGSPVIGWFAPDGRPENVEGDGVRFSLNYGLHMDFRLGANPNYYFSTGLFMFNTGGTLAHSYGTRVDASSPIILADRQAKFRLNYVNVPLTFLMRTNEIGYIRYFARVGFDGGVNIRARINTEDRLSGGNVLSDQDVDVGDMVNLFRAGMHIEGGMEYNVGGNTNIMVSLEWNNGLTNVFNSDYQYSSVNEDGEVIQEGRIKSVTNFIALNVGVYF